MKIFSLHTKTHRHNEHRNSLGTRVILLIRRISVEYLELLKEMENFHSRAVNNDETNIIKRHMHMAVYCLI